MATALIVGGNATSAFMSWRLQATNACDVTLVWKNGYDAVSQYGISFKYETKFLDLQAEEASDTVKIDQKCSVMNGSSRDMVYPQLTQRP